MIKFVPRGPFCVVRVKTVETNKAGVAVPQTSAEGREYYVEAVGSDVRELAVGDRVLMVGRPNEDYWHVPGHTGLILIKESCLALVLREDDTVEIGPDDAPLNP